MKMTSETIQLHEPVVLTCILANYNSAVRINWQMVPPRFRQEFCRLVRTGKGNLPPGFGGGTVLLDFGHDYITGNAWFDDFGPCTLALTTMPYTAAALWQFIHDVQEESGGPGVTRLASCGQSAPERLPWLAYHVPAAILTLGDMALYARLNWVVWGLGLAALDHLQAQYLKN